MKLSIADERRNSLPSQIGWLSLCLLAAGWGPSSDPEIQRLWVLTGEFGLVAALGLDIAQRAREAFHRAGQKRIVERRLAEL